MNGGIHELLNRNLQEVFGEGDATRRRAAIEELYTEDCVLYVPPGKFVGRAAVDKFAGDLRARPAIGITLVRRRRGGRVLASSSRQDISASLLRPTRRER